NDFAIVSTFSPTLTTDVRVKAMSLNGGTLKGAQTLTVTGYCTIAGGRIMSNLTIPAGSTCLLINDSDIGLSGVLTNNGRLRLHGKGGIGGVNSGASRPGGSGPDALAFNLFGAIKSAGDTFLGWISGGRLGSKAQPAPRPAPHAPEVRQIVAARIEIPAAVLKTAPEPVLAKIVSHDGGGIVSHDGGGIVSHDGGGLVNAARGNALAEGTANLVPPGTLSAIISQDGAGLATGGSTLIAAGAGNLIGNDGAGLVAAGAGNLVAAGAGNAQVREGNTATEANGIFLGSGELNLDRLTIDGDLTMDGGVLSGTGLILGNLTNNAGFIAPGHSAGAIAVSGGFTQGANGTLVVENGGPAPDQFDQLLVGGNASLGGHLIVRTIDGYTPDPADTFNPLAYTSTSGAFSSITANATLTAGPNGLLAQTNPAAPNPVRGAPANISTRLRILRDDKVLIGGFIIQGPAGSTKKVLLRGIGPTLSNYGLTDVLADPLLELHRPDGTTVTNDNWGDAPNRDQIPAGFAPGNPKESVIVADLSPGNYTVIERGSDDGIGLGLAEIYDIDANPAVALANISTRGFVDTGDNVIIGGFIVTGSEPAEMLVRATGPSLTPYGIQNALQDPVLELHDANGGTLLNDDWRETQEADIIATTIPPNDNREPAIRATLVPGNYTAIVRGKNGATGVALVEAYKVR
nr:hypothetical protein [Chloroflexota bacterium]